MALKTTGEWSVAGKITTLLIFILLKLFANPTQFLNLTSLKHFISIKIMIMLLTVILKALLHQIVGHFTLNLISPVSSYFSRLHKYLFLLFFYWSNSWLLFFTFGSADKLYIMVKFSISLCTEDDILNATETSVCNFSDFCWCSKHCSFSR